MTGMDESWRDESVIQRNLHLLNSGFMADCTFVVGTTEKKRMQCHKFVLSQGSPVFYAMFNGELKEKGDVKVEDIEPHNFRKMLEFIYSDNTDMENVESALSVCYAAHKYMINTLTTKCINFIKTNMNADIVIGTLEFARLIDNTDLEAESLQYLKNNTCDVLKSASFPNVERTTLLTILSQDACGTSEVEMFSACIRWAKAHKRGARYSLRDALGPDALSLIRFLTMTAQEFASIVVPSKLLQLQEEQDILCRLVTGTGNVPRGFSTSKETRAVITGPVEIVSIIPFDNTRGLLNYSHRQSRMCNGQTMNIQPFNVRVNVECFIYGLRLGGLRRLVGISFDGAPVEDRFGVNLLQGSQLLASAEYNGPMSIDKSVEVNFNKLVLLKANTNYTLQMKYSNLHLSYECTQGYQNEYITTAGVRMNVNFDATTISQIHIARKIQ